MQCFSDERVLIKHKEDCLSINGAQCVDVEEGIIEFKNYFKQLPVPFKIYVDFECNLRDVEIYENFYTKKYHEHVPCSYAYEVFCIDDRFSKPIVVFRGKMLLMNLWKQFFKSISIVKKITKKHLNKNLVLTEEEDLFQQSNNCWIYKKLIDNDEEKVRDYCHVTGKFRGSAH